MSYPQAAQSEQANSPNRVAKPPQPVSASQVAMNQLNAEINTLGEVLSVLRKRLEPVSTPYPKATETTNSAGPDAPGSALTMEINMQAARIRSMTVSIHAAIDLLEI